VSVSASSFLEMVLILYVILFKCFTHPNERTLDEAWVKKTKARPDDRDRPSEILFISDYSMAVHRSEPDLCHHQAMFTNLTIVLLCLA
jgi:hypothetical protein